MWRHVTVEQLVNFIHRFEICAIDFTIMIPVGTNIQRKKSLKSFLSRIGTSKFISKFPIRNAWNGAEWNGGIKKWLDKIQSLSVWKRKESGERFSIDTKQTFPLLQTHSFIDLYEEIDEIWLFDVVTFDWANYQWWWENKQAIWLQFKE